MLEWERSIGLFTIKEKSVNCAYVIPNEVDILDTNYIGVGTGWDAYGDMLSSASGVIETDLTIFPESSSLIDLALQSFEQGL